MSEGLRYTPETEEIVNKAAKEESPGRVLGRRPGPDTIAASRYVQEPSNGFLHTPSVPSGVDTNNSIVAQQEASLPAQSRVGELVTAQTDLRTISLNRPEQSQRNPESSVKDVGAAVVESSSSQVDDETRGERAVREYWRINGAPMNSERHTIRMAEKNREREQGERQPTGKVSVEFGADGSMRINAEGMTPAELKQYIDVLRSNSGAGAGESKALPVDRPVTESKAATPREKPLVQNEPRDANESVRVSSFSPEITQQITNIVKRDLESASDVTENPESFKRYLESIIGREPMTAKNIAERKSGISDKLRNIWDKLIGAGRQPEAQAVTDEHEAVNQELLRMIAKISDAKLVILQSAAKEALKTYTDLEKISTDSNLLNELDTAINEGGIIEVVGKKTAHVNEIAALRSALGESPQVLNRAEAERTQAKASTHKLFTTLSPLLAAKVQDAFTIAAGVNKMFAKAFPADAARIESSQMNLSPELITQILGNDSKVIDAKPPADPTRLEPTASTTSSERPRATVTSLPQRPVTNPGQTSSMPIAA